MDISRKSIAFMIDELITANLKCFMAQENVRHGKTDAEVAEAGKKAQVLNARRNSLIRAIDNRLGEADISVLGKTYGN